MVQNDPEFGCILPDVQEDKESCLRLLFEQITQLTNEAMPTKISQNLIQVTSKMKKIRCLISIDDVISPKIAKIFQKTKFMEICNNLMTPKYEKFVELQIQTSWVMANISACDENKLIAFIFNLDIIESVINCLAKTTNSHVFENLILMIANMVHENTYLKKYFIEQDIIGNLQEALGKNNFLTSENHIDQVYYLINFSYTYIKVEPVMNDLKDYTEILLWALHALNYSYKDLRPMSLSIILKIVYRMADDEFNIVYNFDGAQEIIVDLCNSELTIESQYALAILSHLTSTENEVVLDRMEKLGVIEIVSKCYKEISLNFNILESCVICLNNLLTSIHTKISEKVLNLNLIYDVLVNCAKIGEAKELLEQSTMFTRNIFFVSKNENLVEYFETNENSIDLVLRQLTQNQGKIQRTLDCLYIVQRILEISPIDTDGNNVYQEYIYETDYFYYIEGLLNNASEELRSAANKLLHEYFHMDYL